MRHVRERRTHPLVTTPGRQIDGLVDVREFALGFAGGTVRLARHHPAGVIIRDERGERTVEMPAERPDHVRWVLPVAAFAIATIIVRRPWRRRRSKNHDER